MAWLLLSFAPITVSDAFLLTGNFFPLFRCQGFDYFCGIFSSKMHSISSDTNECFEACVFLPFFFGGDSICGYCPDEGSTTTAPTTIIAPTTKAPSTPTTKEPTISPTITPTNIPTTSPTTKSPSTTIQPTISPITIEPTISPTKEPTKSPTKEPTKSPTKEPTPSPLKCNGHENLCGLRVNEIMFATLHNAGNTEENGGLLPNHELSLEKALDAGYRGISLDIGKCDNGEIKVVHAFCSLGVRDFIEVFTNIVTFLQNNPNEVIIMPTQIDNDTGGDVLLSEIDDLMQQVPMLKSLMYSHDASQPWPTLLELIEANTRILFFHYNGENCANLGSLCPIGFHDWFTYAIESEFEINDITEYNDKDYSCTVARGNSGVKDYYGVNIFTRLSSTTNCIIMNTRESLELHIQSCSSIVGQPINLILIDCWNIGQILDVVNDYNANL